MVGGPEVLILLFIGIAIVIPIWVYSDAKKNSPHSPMLWALVALFGGIIGILLYFLVGRDTSGRTATHY